MRYRLYKKRFGFSIPELLIVLGIIALLMGVGVPVATKVRQYALKVKGQVQFNEYILALDSYKGYYGAYPEFLLNQPETNLAEGDNWKRFIYALNGSLLHKAENEDHLLYLNKSKINFYKFAEGQLSYSDRGDLVGLRDTFGNSIIKIVVEGDLKSYSTQLVSIKQKNRHNALINRDLIIYSVDADYPEKVVITSYE